MSSNLLTVRRVCSHARQMVTAMLMVHSKLSKSASPPLGLLGLLDPARSPARWPYERAGRVAILRYQRAMLSETAAIETPSHPQMLFRNEINVGQAATGKTAGSFTIAR